MVSEVVDLLGGRGAVLDMTVGAGGHAEAMLQAGVRRVVGLDRDPDARVVHEREDPAPAVADAAEQLGAGGLEPQHRIFAATRGEDLAPGADA